MIQTADNFIMVKEIIHHYLEIFKPDIKEIKLANSTRKSTKYWDIINLEWTSARKAFESFATVELKKSIRQKYTEYELKTLIKHNQKK